MRLTLRRWRFPSSPPGRNTGSVPMPAGTRSRRRRAAVALAAGLVTCLGAQLGLGWGIYTERSPIRDPLYFDKLALFRTHPAFFPDPTTPPADRPVTVMFVGSSRTLNGVDTGALGPNLTARLGRPVTAFNFAQAGAGPLTNAVYARRLVQNGAKPDFVLIEVHPVFLAGQRPDPPEGRWLLPARLRPDELEFARGTGFPADIPPAHGPRGWLAPWYEYRFLLVDRYAPFFLMHNIRLNGGHEPDGYGFTRLRTVSDEDRRVLLELTRRQYADYFPGYRPTGLGTPAVRDTLETCRAAGWKAALLLTPESAAFRSWYPAAGLRELDAVLAGLSAEYHAPLIDARTWVPDDLIGDGHHLTGPGADVLTDRLARDALAPWLARPLDPQPRPTP
ncbi:MAG: hypothetical protein JWO38_8071 [Gemmataceae bacterium]|nr:hypothetical protein [Gemmataceae bacterium]